jgi:hypothetical protein
VEINDIYRRVFFLVGGGEGVGVLKLVVGVPFGGAWSLGSTTLEGEELGAPFTRLGF